MKAIVVWISTYKPASLVYCLTHFEAQLGLKDAFDHLIVDTSIGHQAELNRWVKAESARRQNTDQPQIYSLFLDRHFGPASKRNIAYDYLNQLPVSYDIIVEIEEDMSVVAKTPHWLKEVSNYIQAQEAKQPVFWDFFKERLNGFCGGAAILSAKTRGLIHPYPAESSGHYINPIEELYRFPEDLRRKLETQIHLTRIGSKDVQLVYDLASPSANYTNQVREKLGPYDPDTYTNSHSTQDIYQRLFSRFTRTPFSPITLIPGTSATIDQNCARTLHYLKQDHWLVSYPDYRWLRHAICLKKDDYSTFKQLVQTQTLSIETVESELVVPYENLYFIHTESDLFGQICQSPQLLDFLVQKVEEADQPGVERFDIIKTHYET